LGRVIGSAEVVLVQGGVEHLRERHRRSRLVAVVVEPVHGDGLGWAWSQTVSACPGLGPICALARVPGQGGDALTLETAIAKRYMRVTDELVAAIAHDVGELLWTKRPANN